MNKAKRNGWILSILVLCFGLITILVMTTGHIAGVYLAMIFAFLCFILVNLSDETYEKDA